MVYLIEEGEEGRYVWVLFRDDDFDVEDQM
jgi:hypothetical protein